jgi:hypothetical protein
MSHIHKLRKLRNNRNVTSLDHKAIGIEGHCVGILVHDNKVTVLFRFRNKVSPIAM